MAAELIITPAVERDLAEAYDWYESRRFGLGETFLASVDAQIEAILRHPEMHRVIFENYRRGLVRRFPYALFYEFAGNTVTVSGVLHTSGDPNKWRERLPSLTTYQSAPSGPAPWVRSGLEWERWGRRCRSLRRFRRTGSRLRG